MRAAIRDPNPVVYVENRRLYGRKGTLPDGPGLPIGKARTAREGTDVTVVAWSRMVEVGLEAAAALEADGISVEVVDLRSLVPMDLDAILESVGRTGRAVIAHEAVVDFGAGAEISARIMEHAFASLDAPVRRVGTPPVPLPFSPPLEDACIPTADTIADAVRASLGW